MQQRAISVLEPLLPQDAETRVRNTVRQFNLVIREHVRLETGLRLGSGRGKSVVPVHVVPGFPVELARWVDQYREQHLLRLILSLPLIDALIDGIEPLMEHWDDLEHLLDSSDASGSREALWETLEIARALRRVDKMKSALNDLKEIRSDILGVYRFRGPRAPVIELFWMAHAFLAGIVGARIEVLAIATLTHELTHAYTHLGQDIDGNCWAGNGFEESDRQVTEGLAQFYTAVITEKLQHRAPGAFRAYEKLLNYQPDEYRVHTDWLVRLSRRRGEAVRFAMLQARSGGKVSYEEWEGSLAEGARKLSKYDRFRGRTSLF